MPALDRDGVFGAVGSTLDFDGTLLLFPSSPPLPHTSSLHSSAAGETT